MGKSRHSGFVSFVSESSEEIEIQLDADCYALAMISMGTIEELHNHNHTLALYCLSCNRWGEANLVRLIQIGKGEKPVIEARFRCRDCGGDCGKAGQAAGAIIG